jgi:hypothetical protein
LSIHTRGYRLVSHLEFQLIDKSKQVISSETQPTFDPEVLVSYIVDRVFLQVLQTSAGPAGHELSSLD